MSDKPLMTCGHTAQGYRKMDDKTFVPCCVICGVITQVLREDKPDLSNRKAKCCSEKTIKPSSYDLPFFEYRGPGSRVARLQCECGYMKKPHDNAIPHVLKHCANQNDGLALFRARGPFEYDLYYCGCRGWD